MRKSAASARGAGVRRRALSAAGAKRGLRAGLAGWRPVPMGSTYREIMRSGRGCRGGGAAHPRRRASGGRRGGGRRPVADRGGGGAASSWRAHGGRLRAGACGAPARGGDAGLAGRAGDQDLPPVEARYVATLVLTAVGTLVGEAHWRGDRRADRVAGGCAAARAQGTAGRAAGRAFGADLDLWLWRSRGVREIAYRGDRDLGDRSGRGAASLGRGQGGFGVDKLQLFRVLRGGAVGAGDQG